MVIFVAKEKKEAIPIGSVEDLIEALGGIEFVKETMKQIEENKKKDEEENQ